MKLASEGDRAVVHCELGNLSRRAGDIPGAIASYRKALQVNPKHHKAHLLMGLAHASQKKCSRAKAAFKKYIKGQGLAQAMLKTLMAKCK